jgi:hypothetical protein
VPVFAYSVFLKQLSSLSRSGQERSEGGGWPVAAPSAGTASRILVPITEQMFFSVRQERKEKPIIDLWPTPELRVGGEL